MEMEFAPSGLVTETTQKMGKEQHKAPEAANRHGAALCTLVTQELRPALRGLPTKALNPSTFLLLHVLTGHRAEHE